MKLKRSFFAMLLAMLTAFFSSSSMVYARNPWINVAVVGDDVLLKKHFMELLNRRYSDSSTDGGATGDILHFPSVWYEKGLSNFEMTFRNIDLPDLSRQISFLGQGRYRTVLVVSDVERFDTGSYIGDFEERRKGFVGNIKQLAEEIQRCAGHDVEMVFLLVKDGTDEQQAYAKLTHGLRVYIEPQLYIPIEIQHAFSSFFCAKRDMDKFIDDVVNRLAECEMLRRNYTYMSSCENKECCRNVIIGVIATGLALAGLCAIVCGCFGSGDSSGGK